MVAIMIEEWLKYCAGTGYYSQSTQECYRNDLKLFLAWNEKFHAVSRWSMVSSSEVESFIQYLIFLEFKYVSINRVLSALSSFFEWLVKHKGLNSNPMKSVRRLRPDYHQRESLSGDIIAKVLQQDNLLDSTKALISLIFESGIRIGEAMNLLPGDIDLDRRELRIKGKGRAFRVSYFGEVSERYLREYMRGRCLDNGVFPGSRRQYNWDIYHACKPFAGNHKCSPHILRHTFATESRANGVPMDVLMLLLGHKNITTTMLYNHCSSERVRGIANSCAARL